MEVTKIMEDNIKYVQEIRQLQKKIMEKDEEIHRMGRLMENDDKLILAYQRRIERIYKSRIDVNKKVAHFGEVLIYCCIAAASLGVGYTLVWLIINLVFKLMWKV